MTIKILDELERLQADATPGPWARARKPVIEPNFYIVANGRWNWDGGPLAKPDADYLVKAMNTLPALIRVACAAEKLGVFYRYALNEAVVQADAMELLQEALRQLRDLSAEDGNDVSGAEGPGPKGVEQNHERGTSE